MFERIKDPFLGSKEGALEGCLKDIPLPALLLMAVEGKLTGILRLEQGKVRKTIYLQAGYPIFVQSNLRRETLGQMLVNKGKITAADQAQLLSVSREKKIRLEQALVSLELLTQQEVDEQILANIRLKLETCLNWKEGSWLFIQDLKAISKVPHCRILPVRLIFEGMKHSINIEKALNSMIGVEKLEFILLPRFKMYRNQYIHGFGDKLITVLKSNMAIDEIIPATSLLPQETVFQIYILLLSGLAHLFRKDQDSLEKQAPSLSISTEHVTAENDLAKQGPSSDRNVSTGRHSRNEDAVGKARGEVSTAKEIPLSEVRVSSKENQTQSKDTTEIIDGEEVKPSKIPRIPPSIKKSPQEEKMSRQLINYNYNTIQKRNHYDRMGLDLGCTQNEIMEAFIDLCDKFSFAHFAKLEIPDISQKLWLIREAIEQSFNVLIQPASRRDYNRSLDIDSQKALLRRTVSLRTRVLIR